MKTRLVKILGFAVPVLTFTAGLLSTWVSKQEMEETIEKKVNEALAEKEQQEQEENTEEES